MLRDWCGLSRESHSPALGRTQGWEWTVLTQEVSSGPEWCVCVCVTGYDEGTKDWGNQPGSGRLRGPAGGIRSLEAQQA